MPRLFITATGTGVGKTYLACQMVKQLRASGKSVAALKPVISGFDEKNQTNDIARILEASKKPYTEKTLAEISLYRFLAPLSPNMAAEREGKEIDFDAICKFCAQGSDAEVILIEGVGGVMVPLNKNKTTLDLMQALKIPVVLVAGNYLGAISHTLTACSTLLSSGITLKAVIISANESNEVDAEEMKNTLSHFITVPVHIIARGGNPSAFLSELI